MSTFFTNVITWIKANILISVIILIVAVMVLFPKALRGLFGSRRRVRHHRYVSVSRHVTRRRRTLPRSVGMHKAKKPWQIKGSEAARRHMAKIRRMR